MNTLGRIPGLGVIAFAALSGTPGFGSQAAVNEPTPDTTAPAIELSSPAKEVVQNAAAYRLVARITDGGTGIAGTWCNGLHVPVVDGVVDCTVALTPGRNAVVVEAVDRAGNTASTGLTVTFARNAHVTPLKFFPAVLTVEERRGAFVSVVDDFGPVDARVVSLNPDVMTVERSEYGPVLRTTRPGTARIAASYKSATVAMSVTVLPSLPMGSTNWEVDTALVVRLVAGDPNVETTPHLLVVERTEGATGFRVNGIRTEGTLVWHERMPIAPDEDVVSVMGNRFGGLTARVVAPDGRTTLTHSGVQHNGPADRPWRYRSRGRIVSPMAQEPLGDIYVVEASIDPSNNGWTDAEVVRLDGKSGQVIHRHRIPLLESAAGCGMVDPHVIGPTIGFDRTMHVAIDVQLACARTDDPATSPRHQLGVFRISASGMTTWRVIEPGLVSGAATFHPRGIMPLPEDGLLLFDTANAAQISGDSVKALSLAPGAVPRIVGYDVQESPLLLTGPFVTAVDLRTGATKWVAGVGGEVLEMICGEPGNGAAILDDDGLLHIVESGGKEVEVHRFLQLDANIRFDDYTDGFSWNNRWVALRKGRLIAIEGPQLFSCSAYYGGLAQ